MTDTIEWLFKVKKMPKIRKRYNLTQDTTWISNKNTINITNKSQEVTPFPAGDHKAAINRRKSIRRQDTKTQMMHKRSTALERSLKIFYCKKQSLQKIKVHACFLSPNFSISSCTRQIFSLIYHPLMKPVWDQSLILARNFFILFANIVFVIVLLSVINNVNGRQLFKQHQSLYF